MVGRYFFGFFRRWLPLICLLLRPCIGERRIRSFGRPVVPVLSLTSSPSRLSAFVQLLSGLIRIINYYSYLSSTGMNAEWSTCVKIGFPRTICSESQPSWWSVLILHLDVSELRVGFRESRIVAYLERIQRNGFTYSQSDINVWNSARWKSCFSPVFKGSNYTEYTDLLVKRFHRKNPSPYLFFSNAQFRLSFDNFIDRTHGRRDLQ